MNPIVEIAYSDNTKLSLFDIHAAPKSNKMHFKGFFPTHALIYSEPNKETAVARVDFQIKGRNCELYLTDSEDIFRLLIALSILINMKYLFEPIEILDYELNAVLAGLDNLTTRIKIDFKTNLN